jgi:hypothetical protein
VQPNGPQSENQIENSKDQTMRTPRLHIPTGIAAIAAFAFLGHSAPLGAAIPPAEDLLPQDTVAVFTVPDVDALLAAGMKSPTALLMDDPAMKPFRDKFMGKFEAEILKPARKEMGMPLQKALALPKGQFTIAVTADGAQADDETLPAVIVLIDVKDNEELLKENIAKIIKGRKEIRTKRIEGIDFVVFCYGEEQDRRSLYFARYESLVIAGNSAHALGIVAANLAGGDQPCLADAPNFASDRKSHFAADPLYFGWLDARGFVDASKRIAKPDMKEADEDPEISDKIDGLADFGIDSVFSGIEMDKVITATGIGGLKSISLATFDHPEGFFNSFHINVPESTRSGLFKMLALPSKDASIPDFVPADATTFVRSRQDLKQIWQQLQDIASGISPDASEKINGMIEMINTLVATSDPDFDFRKSLIENLGDDTIVYTSQEGEIMLVAVNDSDSFIKGLLGLSLFATPSQEGAPEPREFLGHKIHTIHLGDGMKPEEDGGEPAAIHFSSAAGYLAISDKSAMIEEYIRNTQTKPKGLRDMPGIAAASLHVGGTNSGYFSYENQAVTLCTVFEMVKSPMIGALVPCDLSEWLDFSLLPEPESVAKYYGISVSSARADENGITWETYSANPMQTR